jgi:GrpB-like predicted nucleotidyltransferase (UPF0157 family)
VEEFAVIQAALAEVLGSAAQRIDHIGSTAVPGLGAKDVIDVQITVTALTPEVRDRLAAAGYPYVAKHNRDHVPQGAPAEPHLWAKYLFHEIPGQRPANIHVRVAGNPNQRYPLLFRDYLRAHPAVAATIELIKRELAARHADDADAYYAIKDPVYDLVWRAAQEWAAATAGAE